MFHLHYIFEFEFIYLHTALACFQKYSSTVLFSAYNSKISKFILLFLLSPKFFHHFQCNAMWHIIYSISLITNGDME